MKKHKSVVAILLAVMMIFTMMPSMVFAAKATGWSSKGNDPYGTVTDADGGQYATKSTFQTNGLIKVEATNDDGAIHGSSAVVPIPDDGEGNNATMYYYQMDQSALVYGEGTNAKPLAGTTWTQDGFSDLKNLGMVGVKVLEPAYVRTFTAAEPQKSAIMKPADFEGWTAEVKFSDYDTTKTTEDQKVTVSIEFKPNPGTDESGKALSIDGSESRPFKLGVVASAEITVKGVTKKPSTANFYFDEVGSAAKNDGEDLVTFYDGAAHKVVADEVPGYTASYEVYDATTGMYKAVDAVSITDAQKDPMDVKVTFKKGTQDTQYRYLKVNLEAAWGVEAGFNLDISDDEDNCVYTVPGTEYKAEDYLAFNPYQAKVTGETAAIRAAIKAENEATKKAVAANEALLKEYFNDYYEITEVVKKNSPYMATLTIVDKDLTTKEEQDLTKKYAQLKLNIGDFDIVESKAGVYFNNAEYDYEVEFTKAPAGVTTYKANKKGKLAKNKTIKVKAVANDGATVNYKLINGNSKISINKTTGKITIKKGLKKGTYTFKVKAYVPGVRTSGIGATRSTVTGWYEYQTVKVKIKK